LASLVALGSPVAADPAPRGPDFLAHLPPRGVDRSLAVSDGTTPIDPLDVIAFANDSTALLPSAVAQIDTAASWLRAHPPYTMVLEGHTDEPGSSVANDCLATRRADAVRNHLRSWGISTDRIVLVIYGAAEAKDPENPTDRRVVMFASPLPPRRLAGLSL